MSNRYNTDGMLVYPDDGTGPKLNALESIECTIAFDVRDWGADRRSAWIYAIVFGWGDEGNEEDDGAWDEMREAFGWDEEDIARAKMYHEQWEKVKWMMPRLIDEQPTVNGWISVKDRMPEGKCIAFSAVSGEMLIVRVEADDKSDTGYTGESEARYLWDVTHWMPLPEPPKEDDHG